MRLCLSVCLFVRYGRPNRWPKCVEPRFFRMRSLREVFVAWFCEPSRLLKATAGNKGQGHFLTSIRWHISQKGRIHGFRRAFAVGNLDAITCVGVYYPVDRFDSI